MNEEPFIHATCGAGDYSVEHVASIAARLLSGDHYKDAAKRALALLDACRGELNERARLAAVYTRAVSERKEWEDKYVPKLKGDVNKLSWRAALKEITGEAREERAQARFKRFLTYKWQLDTAIWAGSSVKWVPIPRAKLIEGRIDEIKKHDISSLDVGHYKAAFQEWDRMDASNRAKINGSKRGQAKVKKT